jgi:hypothetical protein
MNSITLRSHVGNDGLLTIRLPDMRDTDVEVTIVYQARQPNVSEAVSLSELYGCIQDDSLIRHPQGEQPERESFE